jgi:predicted type IV restriction endonuclease
MSLSHHIEEVRTGIKAGRYGNEAAVSQGIVLRLLQALGWPTYDTQVVCPEFALGGRRVDYALCHPANKAMAFIEVKQIGQSDGAERQLFEYAFHIGVQLAILTDGQEWNFFLPAEQGDYAERRVYKLDMLERDAAESVARLERYLAYAHVASGAAIAAAREDYRNVSRSRQMAATLPEAWSRLVAEEDDLLLELVADKVESLCGFKPDVDAVARFLRDNVAIQAGVSPTAGNMSKPVSLARSTSTPIQTARSPAAPTHKADPTAIGFSVDGRFVPCRNGKDVLIKVLEALAHRDETFLERFAARPKHGRTRRYLARSADELYPGRPDLASEHFFKLKSGWYVGTNVSRAQIERIVEMACEVSRVRYGKELSINIGE